MKDIMCPATFCPLFAANGSPWTGNKYAPCEGPKCEGFFHDGRCVGGDAAHSQVIEFRVHGTSLQLKTPRLPKYIAAKVFDCPHAHECKWQLQDVSKLCAPRLALSQGIDPSVCAF